MKYLNPITLLLTTSLVSALPSTKFRGRLFTGISGDNSTFTESLDPTIPALQAGIDGSVVGRQTTTPACPTTATCLLGYFADPNPETGDSADLACFKVGNQKVVPGCTIYCSSVPTWEQNIDCKGGWAMYGYPNPGVSCLECIPGCLPSVGGPDEPEC